MSAMTDPQLNDDMLEFMFGASECEYSSFWTDELCFIYYSTPEAMEIL
jgi:hypothetical protein